MEHCVFHRIIALTRIAWWLAGTNLVVDHVCSFCHHQQSLSHIARLQITGSSSIDGSKPSGGVRRPDDNAMRDYATKVIPNSLARDVLVFVLCIRVYE